MAKDYHYAPCDEKDVPGNVRFGESPRHPNGIVTVEYGGFGRSAPDEGDPYKRVIDRSVGGGTTYYRRVEGRPRLRMGGPP